MWLPPGLCPQWGRQTSSQPVAPRDCDAMVGQHRKVLPESDREAQGDVPESMLFEMRR